MVEQKTIGFFIAETPIHCGTGQDIGKVDQPIQREKHTNYPIIQASEIKGVFRQYYKKNGGQYVNEIFGPEGESSDGTGGDYASAVSFGDAHILFFPVKSLKGVYVWVTCGDVLKRFKRILNLTGINIQIPDVEVKDDSIIIYDQSLAVGNCVVIEEYKFNIQQDNSQNFNTLIDMVIPVNNNNNDPHRYLNQSLKKKICIVSNDVFKDFVEMSTEVITRIKIDEKTGVVQRGALWTEEYLPTDTILYFPIFASETKNPGNKLNPENVMEKIKNKLNTYIQIGGNETIGKGFVRTVLL